MKKRNAIILIIEILLIVCAALLMVRLNIGFVKSWFSEGMGAGLSNLAEKLEENDKLLNYNLPNQ